MSGANLRIKCGAAVIFGETAVFGQLIVCMQLFSTIFGECGCLSKFNCIWATIGLDLPKRRELTAHLQLFENKNSVARILWHFAGLIGDTIGMTVEQNQKPNNIC
ncbi:hypothetical protein [Paenibacillus phocaensis]|uniref:hypothetical protein n=1 Tax=Paenibacillus phocaensis TaxID=1776378 RepID=UPI0018E244FB|nr:hypothetical protein [Paenibacillus phocaensis]